MLEYHNTWAQRLGEEGAGIQTIIEMVQHTRLDAAAAPAGLMRQAVAQAIHHARYPSAFGRPLAAQPLVLNVLEDLAIESEAATLLVMRVTQAFDTAADDEIERAHGNHPALLESHKTMHRELSICRSDPSHARRALEHMAILLQGCLLQECSDAAVFERFIASRLADTRYRSYGTLGGTTQCERILLRAWPD